MHVTGYEKAAEASDTDAMVRLGRLFAEQLDPPDLEQAARVSAAPTRPAVLYGCAAVLHPCSIHRPSEGRLHRRGGLRLSVSPR
jgi:hypothetical protein